jgi:hypothetical protein
MMEMLKAADVEEVDSGVENAPRTSGLNAVSHGWELSLVEPEKASVPQGASCTSVAASVPI